nr:hypothetical protein [Tanacetum cinerariifolium]
NPSESEGENGCDMPACFTTFSNALFDAEYEFDSCDDQSLSDEDGIDETDCYHEEDIRLTKRLLYDNSSPRPPEEFVSKNSNADIESFSPSPIPIKDSDSLMKEINLTFNPDDPMPPSIEEDDDDSKRDILILEELLDNDSLSLPVKDKQENDKIGTKPDENEKRRKARQCQSLVTVKKAVKRRKYKFKGPTMQTLEDVLYSRNNTRADIVIYPKNNYKG